MARPTVDPEVREALWDLQRYLSDAVAPMMVTDSIEVLLAQPPEIVAAEIHGWLSSQTSGPSADAPVSDCLFHAMKKLHLMAEFNLIEQDVLEGYLDSLGRIVLGFCPEIDRELLRDNLTRLGHAVDSGTAARVEFLHRQVGNAPERKHADPTATTPAPPSAAPSQVDLQRGMNRLALLIERLGHAGAPASAAGDALQVAALNARDGAEFEGYLRHLRKKGVQVDSGEVFRSLGSNLPGWELPDGIAAPPSHGVEAMHRLISRAADPAEGANRFSEMLAAAIERFNDGHFVQAQTMFELANRIVDEKKIQPDLVTSIKLRCQETVSAMRLHETSQDPSRFGPLKTVLEFFPGFSPKKLLDALHGEPRRDRRKLQLALLEVHREAARAEVLQRLGQLSVDRSNDPQGYFLRNLVYLLRRIEHSRSPEDELDLLVRTSEFDQPPIVIREALGALATWQHTRAERTLIQRLNQIEQRMSGKAETAVTRGDLEMLLERAIVALAKIGTPNALRAVVAHGFSRVTALGNTMARLAELGANDLSVDKELVDHLVGVLRKELPSRVLGFMVHKNTATLIGLIRALAGTPSPNVRSLMEEIAARFPDKDFGVAASEALGGFGAKKKDDSEGAASFSGDVELFGLPNLLQSLCDAQLTGTLTLTDCDGRVFAALHIDNRRLTGCSTGPLTGQTAFYQLFEKPTPGTFAFRKGQSEAAAGEPIEVLPAILEALRRHDEFNQARTIVPGDAALVVGDVKPTPCEGEEDLTFVRSVWVKASNGSTPAKCEAAIAADVYRIRRLYAHWVETGALRPA